MVIPLDELDEKSVYPNPFVQFRQWFDQALAAQLPEPNAMTLATATRAGQPSARMVILRGFDERGFVFYSDYESRKGKELAENPWASLVFYWVELHRQIRIEGTVEKISEQESDVYFQTRPAGSRLATWASQESQIISSRAVLESRMQELEAHYRDQPIPRPPYWGGYRVLPNAFEFWQSRPNRLHDRVLYSRQSNSSWLIQRLSP
jgi:pyridoxamine 5'-phosphate oxidase